MSRGLDILIAEHNAKVNRRRWCLFGLALAFFVIGFWHGWGWAFAALGGGILLWAMVGP